MTRADDEFRPRLGRIRSAGGRASKRYIGKLYAAIEKATPGAFAKCSGKTYALGRIGRGAGLGAAFASTAHPFAKMRTRRVIVKIRSVRFGANGLPKARAHLRYIQRDGAEKDGAPGRLYGPDRDAVDGSAFLEEGMGDRHQFRIIVSPEEAGEIESLNGFTRDLMAAAEKDLGTRLDWVAVNHHDTDHPHVHIVLRGRAEDGKDLVIAKSYISHGFRRRAEDLATLELGPRGDLDIARARVQEAGAERFTSLDRELKQLGADGVVDLGRPKTVYDRFRVKLLLARLRTLEKMSLATRRRDGWRLSSDLEPALKEAGRRGDIIRSMGQVLGQHLSLANLKDFSAENAPQVLIGRVAGSGAADEAHEKRFLAVDGADGKHWHVAIDLAPGATPPEGAIVEVTRSDGLLRKSDLTIAAIAERNGGVYADDLHAASDPGASNEYRLTHKRRLEALRRAGIVERAQDGSWRIPNDYLKRAASYEAEKSAARVRTLSWVALEQLPEAQGQVFLDDVLEGRKSVEMSTAGFGDDLRGALAVRRRFLLSQDLARETGDGLIVDRTRLRLLDRQSLEDAASRLSKETGRAFVTPVEGEQIAGAYRRPIDLPAGRFAIVERSQEFTLVPWREALEARRGLEVSGVMRRAGVTWDFDRRPGIGR